MKTTDTTKLPPNLQTQIASTDDAAHQKTDAEQTSFPVGRFTGPVDRQFKWQQIQQKLEKEDTPSSLPRDLGSVPTTETKSEQPTTNMARLKMMFQSPSKLANAELQRWASTTDGLLNTVDQIKNWAETTEGHEPQTRNVLRNRLGKLSDELKTVEPEKRAETLMRHLFVGNPPKQQKDATVEDTQTFYNGVEATASSYAMVAASPLGILSSLLSLKAGIDIGKLLTWADHHHVDNYIQYHLGAWLPGNSATAFGTRAEYDEYYQMMRFAPDSERNEWFQKTYDREPPSETLSPDELFGLDAIRHHVAETEVLEFGFPGPTDAGTSKRIAELLWPLVSNPEVAAAFGPPAMVFQAIAAGVSTSMHVAFEFHRQSHMNHGQMPLLALFLQDADVATTREHHLGHHKKPHEKNAGMFSKGMDDALERSSGVQESMELLYYYQRQVRGSLEDLGRKLNHMQRQLRGLPEPESTEAAWQDPHKGEPGVPNWWRQAGGAKAALGATTPGLEAIERAGAAKEAYVLLLSHIGKFDATKTLEEQPGLLARLNKKKEDAEYVGLIPKDKPLVEIIPDLRRQIDDVQLTDAQVETLCHPSPAEMAFQRELIPCPADDSWPKIGAGELMGRLGNIFAKSTQQGIQDGAQKIANLFGTAAQDK